MKLRVYAPITREHLEIIKDDALLAFTMLASERGHSLSPDEKEVCFSTLVEVLQFHHLDFLEDAIHCTPGGYLLDWSCTCGVMRTAYERFLWHKAFGPGAVDWDGVPVDLYSGAQTDGRDESPRSGSASSQGVEHADD